MQMEERAPRSSGYESCQLETCCCCFSLRTGSLIIGYISLIGDSILAILLALVLGGSSWLLNQDDTDEQVVGGALFIFAIACLVILSINLVFVIALLVGVHQEKPGCVKAYLIFEMLGIVLWVIMFIASFFGPTTVSGIIEGIFMILSGIYFWMVVKSYYVRMGETTKYPPRYYSD